MKDKQVLVAIVNYRQNGYTIDCVSSVRECDIAQDNILVFDNGNTKAEHDELLKGVAGLARVLYSERNIGYIRGVNQCLALGLRENYQYVLIINNDTIIDKGAIDELIACARTHDDNCIVTGIVYDYSEKEVIQTIGSDLVDPKRLKFVPRIKNARDTGQLKEEIEFDMIDDIFWLVPIDLVRRIGFYNTAYWFNAEQADYALRAKKAGYKLVFTPKAKLWHKGSASIGGRLVNPALTYWNTQSKLILKWFHLPFRLFILDLFSTFGIGVLKLISSFRCEDEERRKVVIENNKAVVSACVYVAGWLFTKKTNSGYNPFWGQFEI